MNLKDIWNINSIDQYMVKSKIIADQINPIISLGNEFHSCFILCISRAKMKLEYNVKKFIGNCTMI